jgi:hypothetical protein
VFSHTTQLKQLETKLELIAQSLSIKHNQHARPSSSPILVDAVGQSAGTRAQSLLGQDAQTDVVLANPTIPTRAHSPRNIVSGIEILTPDAREDEVLLDRYKRLLAPHMPFVVLPPGTSAESLAETEPLLMDAIRVVACFHDSFRQQALAKDLTRQICERLLINGEKSLGLLQGLLIFSNWYNPHLYAPQNSTNILHLALALSTNLNLDRGSGTCEKARMEAAMRTYGVAQAYKAMTNHERRAVLGTFYLISVTSTSFRKVDVARWTPWLADCASALSEAREYQSDSNLVQLVHMQRLIQETTTFDCNAPCQFYAKSILQELDTISEPSQGVTIATVLRLQDACTRIAIWQRSFANLPSKADSNGLRQRLEGMWHCIEAVKVYMDIYMDMPVQDYLLVPFAVFAQFAYAFVVIIRALSLDFNGWDAPALRRYIDLSEIAENASQRYEAVSRTSIDGVSLKSEAFSNWGVKLRLVKTVHDANIASTLSRERLGPIPGRDSNYTHAPFRSDSESSQPFLNGPVVGSDPLLQSAMGFEDFWTGVYDLSQASADFGLDFGIM